MIRGLVQSAAGIAAVGIFVTTAAAARVQCSTTYTDCWGASHTVSGQCNQGESCCPTYRYDAEKKCIRSMEPRCCRGLPPGPVPL